MCTNYAPVQRQLLREVFGAEPPADEWRSQAWPDYAAPIVRTGADGGRESILATFGMVPRAQIPAGVRAYDTMNAEAVGEKRSRRELNPPGANVNRRRHGRKSLRLLADKNIVVITTFVACLSRDVPHLLDSGATYSRCMRSGIRAAINPGWE